MFFVVNISLKERLNYCIVSEFVSTQSKQEIKTRAVVMWGAI